MSRGGMQAGEDAPKRKSSTDKPTKKKVRRPLGPRGCRRRAEPCSQEKAGGKAAPDGKKGVKDRMGGGMMERLAAAEKVGGRGARCRGWRPW